MSDIVERLRWGGLEENEAGDEIERLRADLDKAYIEVANRAHYEAECRNENERLRENRDYWMTSCQKAQESRDTASVLRAAAEAELERLRKWEERVVKSMDAASKAAGVEVCDQIPEAIKNLLENNERLRDLEAAAIRLDLAQALEKSNGRS